MSEIGLIGKKIGMTREFYKTGQSVPVTIVKMEKARVIQVIEQDKRGYKAVQLGLNPLAVHVDTGWDSEESVNNIKNVCNKLNIDYQSYVLNWEEFKDIQLSILKSSIVEVEIPTDVAIIGATHKIASENNIKFNISGGNLATEGILPYLWFYDCKDLRLLKAIQKRFGKNSLKSFPTFSYKEEIYYKFIRTIIRIIRFVLYYELKKS